MHWKVARDPFYRDLDPRDVAEAGFFHDTATRDAPLDDVGWMCTPLRRVREQVRGGAGQGAPIVLLSTGSFAPVHEGHLQMMRVAREAAEAAGWWVVGGYLSPGHDEYITLKLGEEATDAHTRVTQCARATAGSDWLTVDPWEALHRAVAVNFTDVIARLEGYLRHHLRPDVEVAYVFGSDNARFVLTFLKRGRAVVVSRPGHGAARYRQRLGGCPRVLWAEGGHTGSSTRVRRGERALLPPALRALAPPRPTVLSLRAEGAAAIPHWPQLAPRCPAFFAGLEALLAEHFSIRRAPLVAQALPEGAVISLDPMLPAQQNVAISRVFELGGYVCAGHAERPGTPPLATQLEQIPPGRYTLVDDDVVTGATVDAVCARLPERVEVVAVHPLLTGAEGEIADSRDFLLGSVHGGAVVEPWGRAPYVLPYVDPFARCSIPPHAVRRFSVGVWRLNATLFAGSGLRVGDLPAPARKMLEAAGLSVGVSLEDACRWHVGRLSALNQK